MADSRLTQVTTHVADAKARLSGQYKEKPLIEGTVGIFADQIQDIEDTLFALLDIELLANATGQFLDDLGSLVVLDRQGVSDDFYRILIAVKIIKNFSKGEPAALIRATRLIFQTTEVHYMNLGHAAVGLYVSATYPALIPGEFIYENLQEIVAAGVKIEFISFTSDTLDSDLVFAFDGGTTGAGFTDLADPSVGGYWSRLLIDDSTIPEDLTITFAFGTGMFDFSPLA